MPDVNIYLRCDGTGWLGKRQFCKKGVWQITLAQHAGLLRKLPKTRITVCVPEQ